MKKFLPLIFLLAFSLVPSTFAVYTCVIDYSTTEGRIEANLCKMLNNGYIAYQGERYEEAAHYYRDFMKDAGKDHQNYELAYNNLINVLGIMMEKALQLEEWDKATNYGEEILKLDPENVHAAWNMGLMYIELDKLEKAEEYITAAYKNAATVSDRKELKELLQKFSDYKDQEEAKKDSPTSDEYSYMQYYLTDMNIVKAWGKVKNNNVPVVAVIDDGVSLSHPDLAGRIWVDPSASYGSNKIRDFVGDDLASNLPTGVHGTMVAGIIGAISENEEGIAGVAKNVKIMPLRVFDADGDASEENIIKAMNYAIDHGANIINMSLGGSQFDYSNRYDTVIRKAYEKGVIVVIAAGNGDALSNEKVGVDLKVNPISPVCNNEGSLAYSIGVGASNQNGDRTEWTNYNDCILIYAPGVDIVSASIPAFDTEYGANYSIGDGTSFSAPIVSGIIALGYNQYGQIAPQTVIESLRESLIKNSDGNMILDASKYIDTLGKKINQTGATSTKSTNNSDADFLANSGIIVSQASQSAYRLGDNVLRQEVVGMAMKIGGFQLSEGYVCKRMFQDVSASKPNSWACRAIETAADNDVVSTTNRNFRPESFITRAEALAILLKASGTEIVSSSGIAQYGDIAEGWQVNVTNTAFSYGFIDAGSNFRPNQNATRGEIFNMAKRIMQTKK